MARRGLRRVLRAAYSGERAAANAYVGHARSVREPTQRRRIREIEREERAHRRRVGEMLATLGGRPGRVRDPLMGALGWIIAALCFVGGWYVPMWGAGRIERRNIGEYVEAARLARAAGLPAFADELAVMADVEWEHERFFREHCEGHWLARVLPLWDPPPRPDCTRRHDGYSLKV